MLNLVSVPSDSVNSASTSLCSNIPTPDLSMWEAMKDSLTGMLEIFLTNDLMFKYSFQKNPYGLKGFLGATLSIDPETIQSIIIENPTELGHAIDDKTLILDLKITLNSNRIIDIEMQVDAQPSYPERALTYLCRAFDHLKIGEGYERILPCIQVSILCSDLFSKDDPRYTDAFYSEYAMKERTTGKEYSSKFQIRVLSLKYLENADDKENPNGLYQWAKLFVATKWEDVKAVVEKNDYMKSVASGIRVLAEDEKVRQACEAREKVLHDMASRYHSGKEDGRAEGAAEKEQELLPIIQQKDAEIARLKALLSSTNKPI